MIEISFKNFRIYLSFSFFATVVLMMMFNLSGYALWGLYACLIHEAGHLTAMIITEQRIKKLVFYGAGIKIVQDYHDFLIPFSVQAVILFSGFLMNFIVYVVCLLFFKNNSEAILFGTINCIIGVFNLLPLNCMDGGKILVLIFYRLCDYSLALKLEKYLRHINIFLIIVIIAVMAVSGFKNVTLYLTLVYILFSAFII